MNGWQRHIDCCRTQILDSSMSRMETSGHCCVLSLGWVVLIRRIEWPSPPVKQFSSDMVPNLWRVYKRRKTVSPNFQSYIRSSSWRSTNIPAPNSFFLLRVGCWLSLSWSFLQVPGPEKHIPPSEFRTRRYSPPVFNPPSPDEVT